MKIQRKIPEPKELFVERINQLLTDPEDNKAYWEILKSQPVRSLRCNTLKISPENLKQKLEQKGWKISQPWKTNPEVMIVENELEPGELGRAIEHMLGYYYIQELASMLPIIALKIKPNEKILDLCAAPGSKTTQIAAEMQNTGLIIANELSMGRIKILASNLEKCGVTNTIITKKDGETLCHRLKEINLKFDKILVDAPCSGEGTLRSAYKTYGMWNIKNIKSLSRIQKRLFKAAFNLLQKDGEMIYSTCTHAPEENEAIVSWALEEFKDQIEIQTIELPINTRPGITKWQDQEYSEEVKCACRVYPQDNNTEGFFISKFKKLK